jgi:hypothetical protein
VEEESAKELGRFETQSQGSGRAVDDPGEQVQWFLGGVFCHARAGGSIDDEPSEGDLQKERLVRAFGFDEGLTQSIAAF